MLATETTQVWHFNFVQTIQTIVQLIGTNEIFSPSLYQNCVNCYQYCPDYQTQELESKVSQTKKCCSKRSRVLELDKNSAVVFPAIFVIFNFVYWTYFVMFK